MWQPLLRSIGMQNIQIFYVGLDMFIVTFFLAQPDSRSFLPEHCNKIIKQQLCGEELPCLLSFLQVSWCFLRETGNIAVNQPMPIKQAKRKLVSDLLIQIIPPEVLQECTTILQLKFYVVYVVQKLVGHPP